MRKTGLLLILIIIMGILPIPVRAQAENYLKLSPESNLKIYTGTTGYDTLLKPSGAPLIYSQRYTVEYLDKAKWKQITVPVNVEQTENSITRNYSDYLGTTAQVIYHEKEGGIKSNITINSAETRTYRIRWSLDGITNTDYQITENGLNFSSPVDWLLVDWNNAYDQCGDIVNYTLTDSANGKKLDIYFNIGEVEADETFTLDPHLYFQQNAEDSATLVYEAHWAAQTFTTTFGFNITIFEPDMYRVGAPGNLTVGIRRTDGLGHPTGADIVTTTYNCNGITANAIGSPYNITIPSTALNATTKYAIVLRALGTAFPASYIGIRYKAGDVFANGNLETSIDSGVTWAAAADDMTFRLWGNAYPSIDGLTADATFSRDTPGWLNFTISDPDGVADFTTFTIQVNTTGDVNNFTLRWTQAGNAFTEVSDPDNICQLNGASVRTNINATHDLICFNFNITGGQSGLCDVRGTLIDDDGYTTIRLFTSAFTFSYFNWIGEVYDFINSAFGQFGIVDYMAQITTYLEGLSIYFSSSLTRLLALIVQQFRIIEELYNFFIYWTTALIGIVLNFSTFYHTMLDGTNAYLDPIYSVGTLWTDLIAGFLPALPLAFFLWWLDSVGKRAPQTVGGEIQVFVNDMNTAIGLVSYFVGVFSNVANTVIDRVYGLFDAIT